jgi:hypothetical protein
MKDEGKIEFGQHISGDCLHQFIFHFIGIAGMGDAESVRYP